jgi:hypothetical protein
VSSVVRVDPPYRGVDLVSAPAAVPAGYGPVARNVVPRGERNLVVRGGIFGDQFAASFGRGGWVFGDKVLFEAFGNLMTVLTGLPSSGAALPTFTPSYTGALSPYHVRLTTRTIGVMTGGGRALGLWDGGAVAGSLVAVANSPVDSRCITMHQSRLFVLGGSVPGTVSPVASNVLYFSDPLVNSAGATLESQFIAGALAAWQDDVSGLVNQITLPAGQSWRSVASVGRTLYIFSDRAVYALSGSTPATFALSKVLDVGVGGVPSASLTGSFGAVCPTAQGVYFATGRGIAYFDGASLRFVSDRLRGLQALGAESTLPSLAMLPGGLLLASSFTSCWVMEEQSGAWFELQPAFASGGIAPIATDTYTLGIVKNTGTLIDLGTVAEPSTDHAPVDRLANTGGSVTTYAVPAEATSASVELSTPLAKAAMQRVHADVGGTIAQSPGDINRLWSVAVEDSITASQLAALSVPADARARQRGMTAAFAEADQVQVHWRYQDSTPTWPATATGGLPSPSIHAAHIEYQPAQSR